MSVQRQVRIINWIKIAQGILTISVFILGIARLATLTGRRSRSDSWIIGVVRHKALLTNVIVALY
jgi:hypothetical protein